MNKHTSVSGTHVRHSLPDTGPAMAFVGPSEK